VSDCNCVDCRTRAESHRDQRRIAALAIGVKAIVDDGHPTVDVWIATTCGTAWDQHYQIERDNANTLRATRVQL
jgi:hypothetical protein